MTYNHDRVRETVRKQREALALRQLKAETTPIYCSEHLLDECSICQPTHECPSCGDKIRPEQRQCNWCSV